MDLKITVNEEQEAALTRSNVSCTSDEDKRPSLEDFIVQLISDKFDEHVAIWKDRDLNDVAARIKSVDLPPEDIDSINAIVSQRMAKIDEERRKIDEERRRTVVNPEDAEVVVEAEVADAKNIK